MPKPEKSDKSEKVVNPEKPSKSTSLVFSTTHLRQALDAVRPAVSARSPLPVQSCVLLTCERRDDNVILDVRGSNAVFGVTATIDCLVGSNETIAVNAQQLSDFVNLLESGAAIDCYFNDQNSVAEFHSGKHVAKFRTYDAAEYPVPPQLKPTHTFDVDAKMFFDALKRGSIARLPSKSSVLGECVALHIEGGKLAVFSNSSFQFASVNGIDAGKNKDDQYLLPPQTVDYLKSAGVSEGNVTIQFNATAMQVIFGDVVVNTVRQSGVLNYPKSLPEIFSSISKVNFQDFRRAINVVSVLMSDKDDMKVIDVTIKDGNMKIRPAAVADTDTSESELACEHTTPMRFKWRAYQVKDFLSVTNDETVQIRTAGFNQPVNFYTENQESFAYWTAPITVSDSEIAEVTPMAEVSE